MKPLLPQGSVTAPLPVASEAVLLWSPSGGPIRGSLARKLLLSANQQCIEMLADSFWPILLINDILLCTFQRLNLCIDFFFFHSLGDGILPFFLKYRHLLRAADRWSLEAQKS